MENQNGKQGELVTCCLSRHHIIIGVFGVGERERGGGEGKEGKGRGEERWLAKLPSFPTQKTWAQGKDPQRTSKVLGRREWKRHKSGSGSLRKKNYFNFPIEEQLGND